MLEYAVPVWQAIPDYLSEAIEVVQKRSLKIIYPECDSYTDALNLADLPTLKSRRDLLCEKYMDKMKSINLRKISEQFYLFKNTMVCKTERAQSFFYF